MAFRGTVLEIPQICLNNCKYRRIFLGCSILLLGAAVLPNFLGAPVYRNATAIRGAVLRATASLS